MLKVVLIAPNLSSQYPQPPMGIVLIAAVLEKAGYPVSVVDANALNLPLEEITPLVKNADIVGLTAMTPSINIALTTARHVKKAPDG